MMLHTLLAAVVAFAPAVVPRIGQNAPKPAAEAAAVKLPDTPAGRALGEFVASFNAGGDARKTWLESRTTMNPGQIGQILQQDSDFLAEYGPVTVVKVPEASDSKIVAILRHAKSGNHGHLTITVQAEAPHKVSNMQLRGAAPEEIK